MKRFFWNEVTGELTFEKVLPFILLIGGFIGLFCSFALTYDQIKIYQNPNYIPSCNLNPVISCGSEINSKQGAVLGLPNPFFGIAAFAVLTTIGAAILAGAKFKRWFWLGMEAGSALGIGALGWFFFQSVYRLNALCPFCMAVWVVTLTTFWYVTLYNLEKGHIKLSRSERQAVTRFATKHHLDILLLWLIAIVVLILKHFWYYYGKYL